MNTWATSSRSTPTTRRKARKRTALGRFAHESAAFSKPVAPASRWPSTWATTRATSTSTSGSPRPGTPPTPPGRPHGRRRQVPGQRQALRRQVQRRRHGQWLELSITNPAIAGYAGYAFADQADVMVNAPGRRRRGRHQDGPPRVVCGQPANGEVYFTLTNNSNRRVEPEFWSQSRPTRQPARLHRHQGHIVEPAPATPTATSCACATATGAASTAFTWDVYLFGAEAASPPALINLSSLTADQDFSSPDGLAFTPSTGICWIQTDDGAYTDVTNCMMLAALPGQVGDGARRPSATPRPMAAAGVDTYVGKAPTADTLKRFLVGPKGCEITGIARRPTARRCSSTSSTRARARPWPTWRPDQVHQPVAGQRRLRCRQAPALGHHRHHQERRRPHRYLSRCSLILSSSTFRSMVVMAVRLRADAGARRSRVRVRAPESACRRSQSRARRGHRPGAVCSRHAQRLRGPHSPR
jgi:hypothetical protein